jgi:hypothetical protein
MVVAEVINLFEDRHKDPFLEQREVIEKLFSTIPPGESVGYFTNPDDFAYLSGKILSDTPDGTVEDGLSQEKLYVINRFFRTQYYAAPFPLELYEVNGKARNIVANFRGQLAKSPPYQLGNLRQRRNFGDGIVLYWNENR